MCDVKFHPGVLLLKTKMNCSIRNLVAVGAVGVRVKMCERLCPCQKKEYDVQSHHYFVTYVHSWIPLVALEVIVHPEKLDVRPGKKGKKWNVWDIVALLPPVNVGITLCGHVILHMLGQNGMD